MQLREWQNNFQRTVLGTARVDALPLHDKGLSRELSMGIYANAYRERLHEALRSNFPALHQLLGDQDFARMAYGFIESYPPLTASIRWFGAELSNYLRITEPFDGLPIFSELAQFEWALRHTADAANAERIEASYLQTLDAEQWPVLQCALHPSLSILHFDWNAAQVWRALDAGEEPPAPAPFAGSWFIYRGADLMSEWRSAGAYEAETIQLWSRGEKFSGVCEFLCEKIGDAEAAIATAASFMRTWIAQGLLVYLSHQEKNNVCSHQFTHPTR